MQWSGFAFGDEREAIQGDVVRVAFEGEGVEAGAEALAELLDQNPIRELTVGARGDWWDALDGLAPVTAAIARRPRPSLRSLRLYGCNSDLLVSSDDEQPVDLGELGPLWPQLPNLEQLSLYEPGALGTTGLPNLRSLEISVADSNLELRSAEWPSLERLAINLGDPQSTQSQATADDLVEIVGHMPRLRQLAVLGFCPIDDFMGWLIEAPLLEQLETLSLINLPLSDEAAGLLLSQSEVFRKCRLHVDGSDVSVGVREELRSECGACVSDDFLVWDDWRKHFPA